MTGKGAEDHEGKQVFGRAKGIHSEAGGGRRADRRRLPQGRDQPGHVLRLAKKYAGLLPTEMRRLKALEDENARLKKLVADLSLDKEMLQDVVRRKI